MAFKKQKNICKNLNKKTKEIYFSKNTSNGVIGNKQFWNTVTPFLTSKGFLRNEDIAFLIGNKTVKDCHELAKEFKEYYINIVQNTLEKQPLNCKIPIIKNPLKKPLLKPINVILALNLLRNIF